MLVWSTCPQQNNFWQELRPDLLHGEANFTVPEPSMRSVPHNASQAKIVSALMLNSFQLIGFISLLTQPSTKAPLLLSTWS